MKNIRFLTFVLTLATLLLSACGTAAVPPAAPQATASAKVIAMPVAFVGIVESIAGDQWVISGTTVTVDPAIVRDGPFNVGDRVKVEGFTSSDGSLTLSRVEAPTPQETADDNSNDAALNGNTNDTNTNDDHGGSLSSNDDNSNTSNANDDHGGSSVNSNDDNSNTTSSNDGSNVNDDKGSGGNPNDNHGGNSNGSGDNSGSGGSNDNGGGGKDDNGNGG